MTNQQDSIARQVREYLDAHPTLGNAIRLGVANHSAVARAVSSELDLRHPEAVIAACRRYPRGRGDAARAAGVQRLVRRSRIETRTKVAAVTVTQSPDVLQRVADVVEELLDENALCRLIQVSRGAVILVDEESVLRLTKVLRSDQLLSVRKGLVEVSVTSPETVEQTPGLLTLLTGVLSAQAINIVEALSCYTDTIFLLDQEDLSRAVTVLSGTLR
jgi:aspartokinase